MRRTRTLKKCDNGKLSVPTSSLRMSVLRFCHEKKLFRMTGCTAGPLSPKGMEPSTPGGASRDRTSPCACSNSGRWNEENVREQNHEALRNIGRGGVGDNITPPSRGSNR